MRKEFIKMEIINRISLVIMLFIGVRFLVKYMKEFIYEVCKQEDESEK